MNEEPSTKVGISQSRCDNLAAPESSSATKPVSIACQTARESDRGPGVHESCLDAAFMSEGPQSANAGRPS